MNALAFLREVLFKPKFSNLKNLSLIGIQEGDNVIQSLLELIKTFNHDRANNFLNTIEMLEINGSSIRNDATYPILSELILEIKKLKHIKLIGTGIGENIDVFVQSLKMPGIESLDL